MKINECFFHKKQYLGSFVHEKMLYLMHITYLQRFIKIKIDNNDEFGQNSVN